VSIGILSAFTGDFASAYGDNGANAAQLAYTTWHKQHSKCTVKFTHYDDQGNPSQTVGLARQIATDKSIVAVLGPTFSGTVESGMPILNQAQVPSITADATNPTLAQKGWSYFHRTVVNDGQEGPAEAQYLAKVAKVKRVAVLDDTEAYGKGLASIVASALKSDGVQVVDRESLSANATDYSSTINRIKGANADAVYFGGLDPTGAPLIKQLRASGSNILFMGGSGLQTARYLQVGGSAANDSIVGSGGIDPTRTPGGQQWLKQWKATFHQPPNLYSVEWYNATMALLDAIGAGQTSRSAINSYIGSHPFTGATGQTVAFTSNGNVQSAQVYIYKVKNGNFSYVTKLKS
jgi:branched-chain amino acid transport system substrate-binding protein